MNLMATSWRKSSTPNSNRLSLIFRIVVLSIVTFYLVSEVSRGLFPQLRQWICKSRPESSFFCSSHTARIRMRATLEQEDREMEIAIKSLTYAADTPFSSRYSQFYINAVSDFDSQVKLHHLLMKLLFESSGNRRKQIRIGVVGGSSTVPHGVSSDKGYFSLMCSWLTGSLSELDVDVICNNAALGATGSNYYASCINEFFNITNYDILLMEFALNDLHFAQTKAPGYYPDPGSPMEELVRTVLRQNPLLQVILVNFMPLRHLLLLEYPPVCPQTLEGVYNDVAKHYGLTVIQHKHMFCNSDFNITAISRKKQAAFADIYLSKDDHSHGSDLIHLALAEFLVKYFRTAMAELIHRLVVSDVTSITIEELITSEAVMLTQRTADLLSGSTKPIYSSTREKFDADCFVDYYWPYRNNVRLSGGVVSASSEVRITNKSFDSLSVIHLIDWKSFINFNFTTFRKSLSCSSYIPRIAFVHQLCNCTDTGKISITATFTFTDGTKFKYSYLVPLVVTGFKTNFVHHVLPKATSHDKIPFDSKLLNSCRKDAPLIESLHLHIEQRTVDYYPLKINSIFVDYDCCNN